MNPIFKLYKKPEFENTLYLDKDGVLNTALYRLGKPSSPRKIEEIKIKKDLNIIADFSKKKFNLVIISNQPDLSRNLIDQSFLDHNIDMIREYLPISVALVCPHLSSENCSCRKPKTGLILKYRSLFPNNHQIEMFIGDQISDQKCSEKLGIPFIMVDDSFSVNNNIDTTLENYYENNKIKYF
jgi:D-glycero-D-manno-heptose 1,7-bisphosphate phosphatase